MKRIISMLMVTSMLAVAAIPVLADDTAQASSSSAQTSSSVQTKVKNGAIGEHIKNLIKSESFKAARDKIQNLEKKILELKNRDNKLKGLSKTDSDAAIQQIKDEFKSLKSARELTADEKEKLKSLNTQIKQILQSNDAKDLKQAKIKPLADQIKSIIQSKKDIVKQQITQLEKEQKALQETVKAEKAANTDDSNN